MWNRKWFELSRFTHRAGSRTEVSLWAFLWRLKPLTLLLLGPGEVLESIKDLQDPLEGSRDPWKGSLKCVLLFSVRTQGPISRTHAMLLSTLPWESPSSLKETWSPPSQPWIFGLDHLKPSKSGRNPGPISRTFEVLSRPPGVSSKSQGLLWLF